MPENSTPSKPTNAVPTGLHVCPHCASQLVQPVDVTEPAPGLWDLTLRCPECERWLEAKCDAAILERFEQELDRGLATLQREMDEYARASFAEDVERFVTALRAGAILPMDFGYEPPRRQR